jgi:HSP20 family protein
LLRRKTLIINQTLQQMKTLEKSSRTSRPLSRWFNSPVDRFFRNDFFDLWDGNDLLDTVPSLNIREEKNDYIVELAVPGIRKEDFNIDVDGNVMTISCNKESEVKDVRENGYSRREYDYSCFSRSFTLPENADVNKVHAKYNDGILSLDIPKKEQVLKEKAQKIKVE